MAAFAEGVVNRRPSRQASRRGQRLSPNRMNSALQSKRGDQCGGCAAVRSYLTTEIRRHRGRIEAGSQGLTAPARYGSKSHEAEPRDTWKMRKAGESRLSRSDRKHGPRQTATAAPRLCATCALSRPLSWLAARNLKRAEGALEQEGRKVRQDIGRFSLSAVKPDSLGSAFGRCASQHRPRLAAAATASRRVLICVHRRPSVVALTRSDSAMPSAFRTTPSSAAAPSSDAAKFVSLGVHSWLLPRRAARRHVFPPSTLSRGETPR